VKANKQAGNISQVTVAALSAVLFLSLGGCGKSDSAKATQTLAKVNGAEITVHQLNEELARANVQQGQQDQAKKQIMESLIDRQLLESAATKAKLDRDPNVMQAIARAKSQILAQAYVQGLMANVEKPTKAEIEVFYGEHPEAFSARKLVEMKQLLVDTRQVGDQLKDALKNAKSLDEVANWLDAKGIQYDRGEISRNLADLPKPLVERVQEAKAGQLFVIGMGNRTMIITVDSLKNSPVSLADATPQIEQILLNQKKKFAAETALAKLRSDAKIEYTNAEDVPVAQAPAETAKPEHVDADVAHGAASLR